MTNPISTVLLALIFLFGVGHGQQSTFEREVVVKFRAGVLEFPEGMSQVNLTEVTIHAVDVRNLLNEKKAELIAKAFPQFQADDTLAISRTGETVKLTNRSNIYVIQFPENVNIPDVVEELRGSPSVIFAEPNGVAVPLGVIPQVLPDDEHFDDPNNPGQGGHQWNLLNTGQDGGASSADIDAPSAWDISIGSTNTTIGIVDWGVRRNHQDFGGDATKVFGDAGFSISHGTHVAGIAAALTNNEIGIAGVDWNAWINTQRIDGEPDLGIAQAVLDAVIVGGSQIVNNSWVLCDDCTFPPTPRYSRTVRSAFADVYNLNAVATAGMGNWNTSNIYYPAGFGQGIIAVGATDRRDLRWDEDSDNGSNYGNHLDVVAPGVDILSTVTYPKAEYNGDYDLKTGTSMATPHISGIVGLLLAENSNLYNDDIEHIIRISADDVNKDTDPGWDQFYGMGRVNARKALDFLRSPYSVNHWSYDYAFIVQSSDWELVQFTDVEGIPYGWYWFRQHTVNANVSFPKEFESTPYLWGRGVATVGYTDDFVESQNFGLNWCGPVAGTANSSGVTLETYIYELRKSCLGDPWNCPLQGWYPTTVENVYFAYTALGTVKSSPPPPKGSKLVQTDDLPYRYSLHPSYPNPFNPVTTINYDLPEESYVTLVVFDMMGREITTLVNGIVDAGFQNVIWDGKDSNGNPVSSGMYLYRFDAISRESGKEFHMSRKMVLIR